MHRLPSAKVSAGICRTSNSVILPCTDHVLICCFLGFVLFLLQQALSTFQWPMHHHGESFRKNFFFLLREETFPVEILVVTHVC